MTDNAPRYTRSPGALSSAQHAAVDPAAFYADIDALIPLSGIFIDVGGGAGRDAIWMRDRAQEPATVYNIEPDPQRYEDSLTEYPGRTVLAGEEAGAGKIIVVPDDIVSLAVFDRVAPGVRGDFVLCSAVMMFIPTEKHEHALRNLFNLTAEGGTAVLRYRTENLKPGMVKIDHETLENQCRAAGYDVTRTAPLPDPLGRDHVWHQLVLRRGPG